MWVEIGRAHLQPAPRSCAIPAISIAAVHQQQRDWNHKITDTDILIGVSPARAEHFAVAKAQSGPRELTAQAPLPSNAAHYNVQHNILVQLVPGDPVVSHVGSTMILPCWISPPESAEALEIRWYRHNQFSNPVLLYNHGKIQDVQEESYRNRSSLTLRSDQSGGLKDGDVSLRLEKLRVQDDGSFHCYVSGENSYSSEEVVLKITGPWKALFLTFLICALLGSVGFILYKYREKLTETNTEEPKKEPVVEDVNIEELRKHAVEITINREIIHPDLMVTKDCKNMRDQPEYHHIGEEFPFQLCAFGAQSFSSGRHYWEVELCRSLIVVPPDPVVPLCGIHSDSSLLDLFLLRNAEALEIRCLVDLKDGDVSLRLERLTIQDEDSFYCYVSGENVYRSEEVVLKIMALGSTPVLSPEPLDDGRVNISCRSSGWHPKPNITWTSDDRRALHPGGTSHSRGADEMFSVHSWTAVSLSDTKLVSCSLSLRSGELKESRVHIQAIYSDCEEGTMGKPENKVVGDVNIEELRKHADEITIDREHSHPDLMVTKDCKILRESNDYHHTGEEFPFELCAFGAQRFSSGRHYWEVDLVHSPNPPKDFWIIGVVKHGNFTTRDRPSLTPSRGYWFLRSDGPRGFYTNTDPPVKLSLTPRPERLGVLLDYDHGQLSFYNVTENKHLLTISSRFSGSVVPLFNPGAGDKSPITILDCPKPEESAESSQPLLNNNSSDA
ncbi:hypothetical protein cypCar_00031286 [Cyprinus carpio]|nr:hypothetical protein cypCar_00031286 [Cyprinus carpio]